MACQNPIDREFEDLSQRIAEAIESVLDVDVTVMNHDKVRIAGTGRYKERRFLPIEANSAFDVCFETGSVCVIRNPGTDGLCASCPVADRCQERAEICVPIVGSGRVLGVIGVVAFREEQREILLGREQVYINFIQKMASLLEGKYAERLAAAENRRLSTRMSSIVNSMQQAVLIFGADGGVLFANDKVEGFLRHAGLGQVEPFSAALWSELCGRFGSKAGKRRERRKEELSVTCQGKSLSLLADVVPLDPEEGSGSDGELLVLMEDYDRLQKELMRRSGENRITFDDILSVSDAMEEIKRMAGIVASSDSNVLLYGESGTGKELFARSLHNGSGRRDKSFVAINCGAIPDELLESELFGYEKGAFTGAVGSKMGKFEMADGGTIFLDEVGELPLRLQVKLLRVLQEGEVCRLGGSGARKVDVRVLSATNADLQQRIRDGGFREDLYYRLNIIPIHLPPLRERKEDVKYLTDYYVDFFNRQFSKQLQGLTGEAEAIFADYPWPGNIRELRNVLEYAVCLESGQVIGAELIAKRLDLSGKKGLGSGTESEGERARGLEAETDALGETGGRLRQAERDLFLETVEKYRGLGKETQRRVCEELGISRATYYRKRKAYGLMER